VFFTPTGLRHFGQTIPPSDISRIPGKDAGNLTIPAPGRKRKRPPGFPWTAVKSCPRATSRNVVPVAVRIHKVFRRLPGVFLVFQVRRQVPPNVFVRPRPGRTATPGPVVIMSDQEMTFVPAVPANNDKVFPISDKRRIKPFVEDPFDGNCVMRVEFAALFLQLFGRDPASFATPLPVRRPPSNQERFAKRRPGPNSDLRPGPSPDVGLRYEPSAVTFAAVKALELWARCKAGSETFNGGATVGFRVAGLEMELTIKPKRTGFAFVETADSIEKDRAGEPQFGEPLSIEDELAAVLGMGSPVQDLRGEYAAAYHRAHLEAIQEVGRVGNPGSFFQSPIVLTVTSRMAAASGRVATIGMHSHPCHPCDPWSPALWFVQPLIDFILIPRRHVPTESRVEPVIQLTQRQDIDNFIPWHMLNVDAWPAESRKGRTSPVANK